uniref:IS66 family transposase zinc-finger binding domain-containing protein n=1 Tax=Clostridium estertheticum TaxID=238834 RepID=UPI00217E74F3|nr:IS66 family transposase zinc-finger binding domain-containing protein [Clostridium estertheticum]
MQFLNEKDQRIRQLENENRTLQEKVDLLEHNVEVLTQAVLHAAKQRFGASSEKTPPIYGQCFLFGELIDGILDETENKVINIKEHKRPIRTKGDREKLIKALPHEVIECILNAEESMCGICGGELDIIGKKKVRSEMEYIPARLIMKDYVQYVYKCVDCGKNDTNPYDSIICAPVPAPVLTHSFASPSCVA